MKKQKCSPSKTKWEWNKGNRKGYLKRGFYNQILREDNGRGDNYAIVYHEAAWKVPEFRRRLIAAAPKMLEALKALANDCTSTAPSGVSCPSIQTLRMARRAIKDAETQ